jgi:hypothetical protein
LCETYLSLVAKFLQCRLGINPHHYHGLAPGDPFILDLVLVFDTGNNRFDQSVKGFVLKADNFHLTKIINRANKEKNGSLSRVESPAHHKQALQA